MRSGTSSTSPPTPPTPHPGAHRALANGRCDQENIIGQLKSGINALHAPVDDLVSNWAYMLIAALAWNIKSWHAMMMHHQHDRHAFIRMEFKQFLDTVIRIPATVIIRARTITARLLAYTISRPSESPRARAATTKRSSARSDADKATPSAKPRLLED